MLLLQGIALGFDVPEYSYGVVLPLLLLLPPPLPQHQHGVQGHTQARRIQLQRFQPAVVRAALLLKRMIALLILGTFNWIYLRCITTSVPMLLFWCALTAFGVAASVGNTRTNAPIRWTALAPAIPGTDRCTRILESAIGSWSCLQAGWVDDVMVATVEPETRRAFRVQH